MLDARSASTLNKVIQNSDFKKKVSLEEQKAQKEDRFLRGRQITYMIYDYFRVTGAHDTALDYGDWFSITLRSDGLRDFGTRWDEVLLSMTKIPPDDILGSWYKLRTRESDQLQTVLDLYDMEIHQKISVPNYSKLKTMVKRSIDQKLRFQNFDPRNERIETRVERDCPALKEEKVSVTSGKKKASVCKETNCSSRHEAQDRAQKPENTAATPNHEVEVCVEEEKYPRQK